MCVVKSRIGRSTSRDEEFGYSGVSYLLGMCQRGNTIFSERFFESGIVD